MVARRVFPTQRRVHSHALTTRRAIGSGKFSFGLPVIQFHRPGAPPVTTETRSSARRIGARTHTSWEARRLTRRARVCVRADVTKQGKSRTFVKDPDGVLYFKIHLCFRYFLNYE